MQIQPGRDRVALNFIGERISLWSNFLLFTNFKVFYELYEHWGGGGEL